MKRLIIILLISLPSIGFSQNITYNIKGYIKNNQNIKYAYLLRTNEVFSVVPIVEGRFEFKGSLALGDELFKSAYLFLSGRNNINYEEVKIKMEQGIWNLGHDDNSKIIVLEEIGLNAENQLINATIINGGLLTKQMMEKNIAISQRKIPDFVKKHPESPISVNVLRQSLKYYKLDIERAEARFGYPKELFAILSESLKLSKQGLLLKKEIDEIYNP